MHVINARIVAPRVVVHKHEPKRFKSAPNGALLRFLHLGPEQLMVGRMKRILFLALLPLMACQPDEGELRELESRLKTDADRPGKVGLVVALARHKKAIEVARGFQQPLNPDCELPAGSRRTTTLAQVTRGGSPLESWSETRLFSLHPPFLATRAVFQTELGQTNTQEMAWTIVDEEFRAKDPLSQAWFVRPVATFDAQWLSEQGLGLGQTLMDAIPGWTQAKLPDQWHLGTQPMACETTTKSRSPWLERLSGRVTLMDATLVMDSARTTSISWGLADGSVLKVTVTEEITDWKPDPKELRPDLSLRTTSSAAIDATVNLWEERGLVTKERN